MKVSEYNISDVFERMYKVSNSHKSFLAEGIFEITLTLIGNVKGRGLSTRAPKTIEQNSHSKRSVVVIKNRDNSCGYRALFVAKYKFDNPNSKDYKWKCIIRDIGQDQYKGALNLANNAGIKWDTPVNNEIWEKL